MLFVFAFGIDKNVIKIHYYKNVELFYQDLINIVLERGRCISQSKRHYLVLKMAIAGFEGRFLSISFPNSHLIVSISQIELKETLSPT